MDNNDVIINGNNNGHHDTKHCHRRGDDGEARVGGRDRGVGGMLSGVTGRGRAEVRREHSSNGSELEVVMRGTGGNHHRHGGDGHSHSHGHGGHSHGLGVAGDGVWVRVALLLALSVHSVMEGLGLGARSSRAYNLLFAILVHKVRGFGSRVDGWMDGGGEFCYLVIMLFSFLFSCCVTVSLFLMELYVWPGLELLSDW